MRTDGNVTGHHRCGRGRRLWLRVRPGPVSGMLNGNDRSPFCPHGCDWSDEPLICIGPDHCKILYEWDIITDAVHWRETIENSSVCVLADVPATMPGWQQRIHPDAHCRVQASLQRHLKTGAPYLVEYRVRTHAETYLHVLDMGTAVRNEHDTPYRFDGVLFLSDRTFFV